MADVGGRHESGLRYCLTHHGVADVDQDEGDFCRAERLDGEQADCRLVPLFFEAPMG